MPDELKFFVELSGTKHLSDIAALCDHGHLGKVPNDDGSKDESKVTRLVEAIRQLMYPPVTPWWSRIWVSKSTPVVIQHALTPGIYNRSYRK